MNIIARTISSCALCITLTTSTTFAQTLAETPSHEVLNDLKLGPSHQVEYVVVKNNYAYILTTANFDGKTLLELHEARKLGSGNWFADGGGAMQVRDKPWKLFRSRKNLEYSLSKMSRERDSINFQYDWCLMGYTTDPDVQGFRIKTKTGYVPLPTINRQYFMRILNETEHRDFVEVQGLNNKGKVIQRDNGVDEDKPRQWSP
jgi:hypothetical protein